MVADLWVDCGLVALGLLVWVVFVTFRLCLSLVFIGRGFMLKW